MLYVLIYEWILARSADGCEEQQWILGYNDVNVVYKLNILVSYNEVFNGLCNNFVRFLCLIFIIILKKNGLFLKRFRVLFLT